MRLSSLFFVGPGLKRVTCTDVLRFPPRRLRKAPAPLRPRRINTNGKWLIRETHDQVRHKQRLEQAKPSPFRWLPRGGGAVIRQRSGPPRRWSHRRPRCCGDVSDDDETIQLT